MVSGRDVTTSDSTRFLRGDSEATFGEFQVGEVVRVKGTVLGDDGILADQVSLEP
jgi:hypothetical protein